jgi:hypothetical protein
VSSINNLKIKARFLRNAAPQAYDDFFVAFAQYTEEVASNLIMVTDDWKTQQGHAQQCVKIVRMLEEAKNG